MLLVKILKVIMKYWMYICLTMAWYSFTVGYQFFENISVMKAVLRHFMIISLKYWIRWIECIPSGKCRFKISDGNAAAEFYMMSWGSTLHEDITFRHSHGNTYIQCWWNKWFLKKIQEGLSLSVWWLNAIFHV